MNRIVLLTLLAVITGSSVAATVKKPTPVPTKKPTPVPTRVQTPPPPVVPTILPNVGSSISAPCAYNKPAPCNNYNEFIPNTWKTVCTDADAGWLWNWHGGYRKFQGQNNLWGTKYMGGYPFKSCSSVRVNDSGDSSVTMDWKFEFDYGNGNFNGDVKAYPALIYGWKPSFWKSTAPNFPVRTDQIKTLSVSYDLDAKIEPTFKGNLSTLVYLVNNPMPNKWGGTNQGGYITHEMMIWEYSQGFKPINGTPNATTTIDGVGYDVYIADFPNWKFIAYVRQVNVDSGSRINFKAFLRDATARNWMRGDELVSHVELGTEIVAGKGSFTLTNPSVNLVKW